MLVLTRKLGERIVLDTSDGPVTVTLLSASFGKAKLGLEAEPKVRVTREELLSRRAAGDSAK